MPSEMECLERKNKATKRALLEDSVSRNPKSYNATLPTHRICKGGMF